MSLGYAILGLLTYESLTGYELKQRFDSSINYFWSAHLSQIYRELVVLEKKSFVTVKTEPGEGRPDRKVYRITREGDHEFQNWLEKFPNLLSSTLRDEFLIRVFFGSRISTPELKYQLQKYMKEQQERLAVFRVMENRMNTPEKKFAKERFYWFLTLKRGISCLMGDIQWAEECLQLIEEKERGKK